MFIRKSSIFWTVTTYKKGKKHEQYRAINFWSGECCKLPQWGPGRSPGRYWFCCFLNLAKRVWKQQLFSPKTSIRLVAGIITQLWGDNATSVPNTNFWGDASPVPNGLSPLVTGKVISPLPYFLPLCLYLFPLSLLRSFPVSFLPLSSTFLYVWMVFTTMCCENGHQHWWA